jgi:tRNA(Ile)-lysidine synthase
VHSLAERVLFHVRRQELLKAGERVGVAVSGGIDSVALLRLLLELRRELGIVLSVVHFNHKLRRDESDRDEHFVSELAREHDLQFYADNDDVAQHAAAEHISVETAARELRYAFFRHLLGEDGTEDPRGLKPDSLAGIHGTAEAAPLHESPSLCSVFPQSTALDKIVTGHTLDDQAETVLMRLIRGSGLRGLGGIHPRLTVENDEGEICGEIVRPLLAFRRQELEEYVKDVGQGWHEDSTNTDERFTRNRVRKLVVPLLKQEFNPAVAENLADFAEIARGEEDYWENEIAGWLGTTVQWCEPDWASNRSVEIGLVQIGSLGNKSETSKPADLDLQSRIDNAPWLVVNASLSRMWFLAEPVAVQRRLVKAIGEHVRLPLDFKHVEEILRFAAEDGPSGKELSLPLGWKMVRELETLLLVTPDLRAPVEFHDYEYEIPVVGRTVVVETGSSFEAQRVRGDGGAGYNPDHLLDAESLPGRLRVRNWRAGDRFWPAHTKSPKKVKELLQEGHIVQSERRLWPVVVSGDEIVWMRGFPVPAKFRAKAGCDAIAIVEKPVTAQLAT